jgi:hypothetical protein
MSRDGVITATSVMIFALFMLAVGFFAGRQMAPRPLGAVSDLLLQIDSLQLAADSLAALAEGHADESNFWRIQAQVTNQLLVDNAAALDSFNRLNPQRYAQRMFIAGAAAAELDSFFAARYPSR